MALILVAASTYFGCATLPDAGLIDRLETSRRPPKVESGRGPLSAEQSRAILERLRRQVGETDILDRHVALEEAVSGAPLTVGNQVRLLNDGPATYRAMFAAIEKARDHINLEAYIFEDDEIGHLLADLLRRKQAAGVQVNLIYDSVGSIKTPRSFFDSLRRDGIAVVEFNPINPLAVRRKWLVNQRDHRKILVVDGEVAYTGGINISSVYASSTPARGKFRATTDPWRDVQVEVRGPAVADFQKLFIENWYKQKGPQLANRRYFPTLGSSGRALVRVIGGYADERDSLVYITLLSALSNAEHSIHIENAYFVPTPQLVNALIAAARRGVDVHLILPGYSDFWAVLHAGRSHYGELLAAGIKIHERHDALLHAKTAVIDGVWSTVGSTNLDWRSFLHNDEVNAVVLGHEFAEQMEATFQQDVAKATPVTREAWERRPAGDRLKEFAARLWEYWL